jgi:hypothetical protein
MTVTSSSSRRDYLDEVVSTLWPAPSGAARRVRPWQSRGAAGSIPQQRYALVPSARHPAVAVPLQSRRGAAAVIANYKASARGVDRLGMRSLAGLARTGAFQLWPAQLVLSVPAQDSGSLEDHLSRHLGQKLRLSVYTSPPRANRKPVAQLVDATGQIIGYAKVGVNALTGELVRAEAEALATIAARPLPGLQIPQLLYHGRWRDHSVIVQGRLDVRTSLTVPSAVLTRAMKTLSGDDSARDVPALDNSYLAGLDARLAEIGSSRGRWLREALGAWRRSASPQDTLRLGAWHGDWTPWNMAYDGTTLSVWDWERYQPGVPLGYDALHFTIQAAIVGRGRGHEPADAVQAMLAAAPTLLEPFGLDRAAADRTALLYLLEIGARYEADGQESAGARLGTLENWLMPALAGRLDLALPLNHR